MSVTDIIIKNQSFTVPMFIAKQARKSPPMPEVAPLPYRSDSPSLAEQAALMERAEEIVDSIQKPTGGNPHPRIVRMPRWQADGEPTAANWVSKTYNDAGKALREDHAKRMRDATRETQRIIDDWAEPVACSAIQPTAEQTLRVNLRERLVITCADPTVSLHVQAPAGTQAWLVLRARDGKNISRGENIGPGQSATLALGKTAAIVQQNTP